MPDYVILRRSANAQSAAEAPTRRGPLGVSPTKAATPAAPQIARHDLSASVAAELSRQPEVAALAPSIPIRLIAPLDATPGAATEAAWGVAAVGALTSRFTGAGAVVAVLDTGIDATHPAFADPELEIVQRDFTGEGDGDPDGHGTHCAGTILGRDVDGVRIGVARGVKKLLVGKVIGQQSSTSAMLFDALTWAIEQGADVISMSLGFDFPGYVAKLVGEHGYPVEAATSEGLEGYRNNVRMLDAILEMARVGAAFGRDPVVIAAAGNESKRPTYAIAASVPAAALDVISVAALQADAAGTYGPADFSNNLAVLAGPGVDILSAQANTGKLAPLSGTSMACPHVAGVAALWWEALLAAGTRPSGANIAARLRASSRFEVIAGATDVEVGLGMVTAPQ